MRIDAFLMIGYVNRFRCSFLSIGVYYSRHFIENMTDMTKMLQVK